MEKKETYKITLKKIMQNLVIAILILIYFIISRYLNIQISSLAILLVSIITFEIAYHKDRGDIAINGIEILILAVHTLIMNYIIKKNSILLEKYILFSSCVVIIYYTLKLMLIYTQGKRNYVKGFSDIHEIVRNDPTKKEAQKRKKEKENN